MSPPGRSLAAIASAVLASLPCPAAEQRFNFTRPAMGTTFHIACYAADEKTASSAAEAAFRRIEELDAALSDYVETSELRRLCATSGRPVPVSADLFAVLEAARGVAERTDGAFDFTLGHLTNLWRRSRRQKELPSAERIATAMAAKGWRHVFLAKPARTIELSHPGMALDLGGIAKGFAADAALAVMTGKGLSRAIVIAGGDMAIGDPPPGQAGWDIKLRAFANSDSGADDLLPLTLRNSGVSTSGDLYQFVEIAGTRYSHIVDPQTGLGLTRRIACSVIAANATMSDAYATAFCVLGSEGGRAVVLGLPGVAARWIALSPEGRRLETRTPGFPENPQNKK